MLLPTNIRLGWKGLLGRNASLLRTFLNYDRKKFYSTGPRETWLSKQEQEEEMPFQSLIFEDKKCFNLNGERLGKATLE
jgi:hypothetical protein